MAKSNSQEKLNNIKIENLKLNTTYKVCYSCFGKRTGSRGDFMSASFIIENAEGNKCWVSSPTERAAWKAIGIMTGARINGNKVSITGLHIEKNGKYLEMVFDVSEYIPEPEINEDEFEDITDDEVFI